MKRTLTILSLAAIVAAGCGTSQATDAAGSTSQSATTEAPSGQKGDAAMIVISGELTYRERIALIPGGTATVSLIDTSVQDVAAPVIATTTIELGDRQVPIPFELTADVSKLDPRAAYSVRATITGPGGDLQWTTDTASPIDIIKPSTDLGMVILIRAGEAATDTDESAASPLVGAWDITEIDGTPALEDSPATLVFGADGTIGGNSGCNSFSSTYTTDGAKLTIESEIAMTLMACDPETGRQESALLTVLSDLDTFDIAGDTLTVTSSDGARIVAER